MIYDIYIYIYIYWLLIDLYGYYFENIVIELHVVYALNTHVKVFVNVVLFTIWSMDVF